MNLARSVTRSAASEYPLNTGLAASSVMLRPGVAFSSMPCSALEIAPLSFCDRFNFISVASERTVCMFDALSLPNHPPTVARTSGMNPPSLSVLLRAAVSAATLALS